MEQVTLSTGTIANSTNGDSQKKSGKSDDNSLFAMLLQSIYLLNPQESLSVPSVNSSNSQTETKQKEVQELLSSYLFNHQFQLGTAESSQILEDASMVVTDSTYVLNDSDSIDINSLLEGIENLVQLLNKTQVSQDTVSKVKNSLPNNQQELVNSLLASIDIEQETLTTSKHEELISKLVSEVSSDNNVNSENVKVSNKKVLQLKELNDKILTILHNVNEGEKTNQAGEQSKVKLDDSLLQSEFSNQTFELNKNINQKQQLVSNQPVTEHLQQNKDFTSELGKILVKSVRLPDGISQTNIQLHPEELGQINVKLTAHQGTITAQFMADTVLGKEMLDNQMHQLRHNLVQQGFQVDKIDVQVANTSNSSNTDLKNGFQFSQQHSQHQQSQQQNRQRKNTFHLNAYSDEADGFMGASTVLEGIDYTA